MFLQLIMRRLSQPSEFVLILATIPTSTFEAISKKKY
jgi:hypothetical protein